MKSERVQEGRRSKRSEEVTYPGQKNSIFFCFFVRRCTSPVTTTQKSKKIAEDGLNHNKHEPDHQKNQIKHEARGDDDVEGKAGK